MSHLPTRRLGVIAVLLLAAAVVASAFQLAPVAPQEQIRRLEIPSRVASQEVEAILAKLALKPGLVVADIGAGTGVFSRPFARAVGPTGRVYAVDIEPMLIGYLLGRAAGEQIPNIEPVLGVPDDPQIPRADVDLAFMNDVLHHIEHKGLYIKNLAKYMKPASRIAIVEFSTVFMGKARGTFEGVPLPTREEVAGWTKDVGFDQVQEVTGIFPNGAKWVIVYSRKGQ